MLGRMESTDTLLVDGAGNISIVENNEQPKLLGYAIVACAFGCGVSLDWIEKVVEPRMRSGYKPAIIPSP